MDIKFLLHALAVVAIATSDMALADEQNSAQDTDEAKNSIELRPFQGKDIYGPGIEAGDQFSLGIDWEHQLSNEFAIIVGLSVARYAGSGRSVDSEYWSRAQGGGAGRLGLGFRYYFSETGAREFRGAAYTGLQSRIGQQNTFYEHPSNNDLDISEYSSELDSLWEVGYRVKIWDQALIRLGVGLKNRKILSRRFDGKDDNPEMAEDIEAVHDDFTEPFVDLGLGLLF